MGDHTSWCGWASFAALVIGSAGGYFVRDVFASTEIGKLKRQIMTMNDQVETRTAQLDGAFELFNECRDRVLVDSRDIYNCSHDLVVCQKLLREGWACGPMKGLK